jgi:hypothetical protein
MNEVCSPIGMKIPAKLFHLRLVVGEGGFANPPGYGIALSLHDVFQSCLKPIFRGEELPMPLAQHHKGMKIPSSPPGLATFPLSNFWRGGEDKPCGSGYFQGRGGDKEGVKMQRHRCEVRL